MTIRTREHYVVFLDDYTDTAGNLEPDGYWILSTDGVEVREMDGPYATKEEAEARRVEFEDEAS